MSQKEKKNWKQHNVEQGSEEWFEDRRKIIKRNRRKIQ